MFAGLANTLFSLEVVTILNGVYCEEEVGGAVFCIESEWICTENKKPALRISLCWRDDSVWCCLINHDLRLRNHGIDNRSTDLLWCNACDGDSIIAGKISNTFILEEDLLVDFAIPFR